jgi:tetratricopeptide (TPR) repeat protein
MHNSFSQQNSQSHHKGRKRLRKVPIARGMSRLWLTATCILGLLTVSATSGFAQSQGSGADASSRATNLFRQAKAAKVARDWKDVIAKATAALEIEPDYVDAFEVRASARLKIADYSGAVSDYTAVLERQPDRSVAQFMRAGAFVKGGEVEKGIADYTALIDSDKEASRHPRYSRAIAYLELQRINEAVVDLEAEIDSFPHELPRLGDLFMQVDRAPYAARCYSLAIVNSLNDILNAQSSRDQNNYWAEEPESPEVNYSTPGADGLYASPLLPTPESKRQRTWEPDETIGFHFERDSEEELLIARIRNTSRKGENLSAVGGLYERRARALFQEQQVRDAICDLNESLLCATDERAAGARVVAEIMKHSDVIIQAYYAEPPPPPPDALVPSAGDLKALAYQALRWTPEEVAQLVEALAKESEPEQAKPQVRYHYAMLCLASDQAPLAANALKILFGKDPQDPQLLRFCAEAALRLKEYRSAGFASTKLIKLSAADDRAYEIRAIAYLGIDDPERAAADLNRLLRIVSEEYEHIAALHAARQAEDTARKVIEQTTAEIESQPQRGSVNYDRRAEAYIVLGDYKSALADYNRADKLSSPGYYNCQIGNCLLALNEARRALMAFKEDAEQSDSDGLLGRAQSLAALGRHQEAIPDFEAAMKGDPKNGAIYSGLADALLKTNDLKGALQAAEAGRALYDWDGMDIAALAAVYAAHENFKEAASLQYKALQRAKSQEGAAQAAKALSEYLVRAFDGDALAAYVSRIRKEAGERKKSFDDMERRVADDEQRKAEREQNANPYLEHGQTGSEEEE